ncbi:hypothetical protein WH7805_03332 [Synechococcus sp. WH 7805]|nr:hypothetical protein WH7805_03332 [Synechococcus sp. WH 7805]
MKLNPDEPGIVSKLADVFAFSPFGGVPIQVWITVVGISVAVSIR